MQGLYSRATENDTYNVFYPVREHIGIVSVSRITVKADFETVTHEGDFAALSEDICNTDI